LISADSALFVALNFVAVTQKLAANMCYSNNYYDYII